MIERLKTEIYISQRCDEIILTIQLLCEFLSFTVQKYILIVVYHLLTFLGYLAVRTKLRSPLPLQRTLAISRVG